VRGGISAVYTLPREQHAAGPTDGLAKIGAGRERICLSVAENICAVLSPTQKEGRCWRRRSSTARPAEGPLREAQRGSTPAVHLEHCAEYTASGLRIRSTNMANRPHCRAGATSRPIQDKNGPRGGMISDLLASIAEFDWPHSTVRATGFQCQRPPAGGDQSGAGLSKSIERSKAPVSLRKRRGFAVLAEKLGREQSGVVEFAPWPRRDRDIFRP